MQYEASTVWKCILDTRYLMERDVSIYQCFADAVLLRLYYRKHRYMRKAFWPFELCNNEPEAIQY